MARIEYTTYRFNSPSIISVRDYEILKEILKSTPAHNLNPPSSFFEIFKVELIFLGIGALGCFIVSLDMAEWLNWVGGIPAFIAFG